MALGDVNTYARRGKSGGGFDLASLAGSDQLDSFSVIQGCSSAFYCVNTADNPIAVALWNGNTDTTGGGNGTGLFHCTCDPIPDDYTAITGWTMPPIWITMIAGATTGDFNNITYTASTGEFVIDWNVAAGTAITADTFAFFVLVLTPWEAQNYATRTATLEGGD